jgi:hypothetical protein
MQGGQAVARGYGPACFCECGRAESQVGRAHLSVPTTDSPLRTSHARHIDQVDSRSGRHEDVGDTVLLQNGRGGGELARGQGSQGRWGKPRAGARGLTGARCRAAGPRERAPCERALRHDRSVGRWLDEDPHWPNPRLGVARLVRGGCDMCCLRGRMSRFRAQCMLRSRLIYQMKASNLYLIDPVTIMKAGSGPVEPSVAQVGRS